MNKSLPYTKIPYADRLWSITTGCTPCSEGCRNCWAQALLRRFPVMGGTEVKLWPNRLSQPAHTRKPSVVFVAPAGDLFHEEVPLTFRLEVIKTMRATPEHVFIVLTKRPERMRETMCCLSEIGSNVWAGVSVEDQATADERVPLLLESGWPNLWVSAEPLLGEVSLKPWLDRISWVVDGCEGGAGARPCDQDWQHDLATECRAAGVTHYSKQHRWSTADVAPGYGEIVRPPPTPEDLPFRLAKWGPAE